MSCVRVLKEGEFASHSWQNRKRKGDDITNDVNKQGSVTSKLASECC